MIGILRVSPERILTPGMRSTLSYGLRSKVVSTCIVRESLFVISKIFMLGTGFLVTGQHPKSNL